MQKEKAIQQKNTEKLFQNNSDLVIKFVQNCLFNFTFSSSRRFSYPDCAIPTFFFSIIRSQENFPLICFRIALQMVNAICGWSHRGVEVSRVNDVGFWEPVAGVRQLGASLYHPFTKGK